MKKATAILSLSVFLFVSIIMPYGNFDDNYATRILYNQQQEQDPDLTLSEFVFEKLLCVGELFEEEDDDTPAKAPVKNSQPLQTLQIQAGFIEFPKPAMKMLELPQTVAKPTCLFKENKFTREFSSPIFHPPAIIS